MFTGKFIVENNDQYITVFHACVIADGDPKQEFEANEIPLSIPHSMFIVQITREPKECGDSTYFEAVCYQYNAYNNSRNVQMKFRMFFPTNAPRFSYLRANNSINKPFMVSDFIMCVTSNFTIVEVTDIDFINANTTTNSIKNVQESTSSVASSHRSDIDLIAEDIDAESSTSRSPKRPRVFTSRSFKNATSASPIVDESVSPFPTFMETSKPATPMNTTNTVQNQKGKVTQISVVDLDEDDPYYDLSNDIFSGYQTRININANHPRAPILTHTFLSENQHQSTSNLTSFPPWQPSPSLISLNHRFQTEILYMFPCVPCSHCSILMFSAQAKWVLHDINVEYKLCQAFPHLSLTEHPNKEGYIAICTLCISITKRHDAPILTPIPDALANVPMFYRRWLSPIHLSCSLGRAENTNCFTYYRHLTGAFGLSKNIRALQIYTGTLGAILDSTSNNNWFHPSLLNAASWLKINNRFFRQFDQMFSSIVFAHSPNHHPDIVVPPYEVLNEIRNGVISTNTLQVIDDKIKTPSSRSPIDTTHLVGFRAMANNINKLACLTLPQDPENPEPIISIAIDHINNQECDAIDNDRNFSYIKTDPAVITEYN
ncbi:15142_t:CDS:2 [Dentiscutata erythropus]|uniref:15142_t:CDS:1 n=1 Tax=Dentiscutata erythropus TaxID=1348616 RepID=A0A9N8VD70_9GLOM|nr:15142_t:CDS:2 [Dentiscutata erythropus]